MPSTRNIWLLEGGVFIDDDSELISTFKVVGTDGDKALLNLDY